MSETNHTDIAERLDRLTELSVELSNNHDVPSLLEHILKAAKTMTGADGGTLYRVNAEKTGLSFNISMNDTLKMYQGGKSGTPINLPDLPLKDDLGNPNLSAVAAYAANTGRSVNIPDVYQAQDFNFSGMRNFDQAHGYHTQSLLSVPMRDHEGELIGVLQLINAIDQGTGKPCAFTDTDRRFIEALASQAAIAITNQQLIVLLEELFESFVKLINLAIDEKSPHTGKHCEHVPELTMMLAQAVHETESGPLANFKMTERDRRELWLAGLLHDCGKIVTPVHVVEKGTKLETITDRIHLVDARFEVLKRDAHIRALEAKLEGARLRDGVSETQIEERLHHEIAQLDEERAFLRKANVGGEFMQPEHQQRVKDIAQRRWTGPDGLEHMLLNDDEVKNLTIRAGTLTEEERQIINNHIVVTIRMLEALPWPKHLRNVPEYAGGHHERMDGKGYPRGLTKTQMSPQARMMAIADIFEALTAADRPYKKGKTLTESLNILGKFATGGHIDPDLFDIFIRRKIYLQYAQQYMDPAQIDAVDESAIPGYAP
jgi:HD-GYP domain-containing protein (c-di-GMP phosphodiesterase class II)